MIQFFQLPKEEKYNVVSHAIGAILSLIGLLVLFNWDTNKTEYSEIGILVYGIALVFLFSSSTIYHVVSKGQLKERLRILDHISIYFLIAGTYTPVALIVLENTSGWMLFYVVWGIAAIGTILKLFFTGKFEIISLVLYAIMGWLILFDLDNLKASTSESGVQMLFLGGVFYTVGIIFYAVKRIPYNHFIWHLFVLAGAFCHWLFVYKDVI